ncbi:MULTISPECIES: phosphotransferase [unclassified Bacillus (in: firmicutes)]|uniref:phosphotransferase n=1 Tax=unclassified Bacillus (in: firmicutes) TaxID=185979 RepID=UPI0008F3D3CC|nr:MULTISPECIES: phosphotransferase [unclassified Bacillus (in: firmicutes)]SFB08244.1 Predicted kinase, aminoglycoside phosphotransferase (APT) family [Bacillus sp. UNCCL13]SFQ87128.1 Predicted kinase, aminoglycoside phosphotransferase (APT) family [Bacillus sp. cl95]
MPQPWTAEIVLTEKEAEGLILSQFPQLSPITIKLIGKGFDNTVFKVNNQYVFRFPRREVGHELLEIENMLLPAIVATASMAIPKPIFFGHPSENYPWSFTGYRLVEGITPSTVNHDDRLKSVERLAEFLKVLHSIPINLAEGLGVPYDTLERLSIKKRKEQLKNYVQKAVGNQLIAQVELLTKYVDSLEQIETAGPLVLVHGDLHIRNLLLNSQNEVSGIIDWGDTHIGNPAVDLSIAYSFIPNSGRGLFFEKYGQVKGETKKLARFKAIYTAVLLLVYGHDLQDGEIVKAAQESIHTALEGWESSLS